MSRKKKSVRIDNSLTELVAGVQVASMMTGGSTLSSYGTAAHSNNYSLITMNRIILTYMYIGNGIFQTAIQLPIQDALSRGIEIESGEMDSDDIRKVMSWWVDNDLPETVLNYWSWVRLYGGGGIVINSNQDPAQPLNIKDMRNSPVEFYDLDRWMLTTRESPSEMDLTTGNTLESEYFYIRGQPVHTTRVIKGIGKKAPSHVERLLRGWGMSEGERMIRDLNLYLKTQDVLYEILDESKLDIYKIQGLANKLLTSGGTTQIQKRIMAANQIKSYVNALVMDISEEYEQKQMAFTGVAEVMRENRIGVSAALRMPMTKLFGLSASGFNTGESDLENYNAMVESEVRAKLLKPIRQLLDIGMIQTFGYLPEYEVSFPPLRILTAKEEEEIKQSEQSRILSLYDRGLMDSQEVGEALREAGITKAATKAERGLLPPQPTPPAGPGMDTGIL